MLKLVVCIVTIRVLRVKSAQSKRLPSPSVTRTVAVSARYYTTLHNSAYHLDSRCQA